MTRTHKLLIGLLLLQVVLIVLVRNPFVSTSTAGETRLLFPALESLEPSRLQIRGDSTEGAGKTLTLVQQGERWAVEEADGFPVDETRIDSLLDKLREIEVRRPVVATSRYHEAFEVEDDANKGRVRIWGSPGGEDGKDAPAADVIVGSSPNYRVSHVRAAGDDPVYEAQGIAPYDVSAEPENWIDKDLIDIPADQLTAMTVTNESGSYELTRTEGGWTITAPVEMAGKPLDTSMVQGVVDQARTVRMANPAGRADEATHGFEGSGIRVELRHEAEPGQTRTTLLRVGGKAEDDSKRYVTRGDFEFAGTIWESSINKLIELKLDDLLIEDAS